jgi:hypothetical protein
MKRFFLALLMLVLPLQAVLAAVETYHGHGAEHESAIEAVFHTHDGYDHHAAHHEPDNNKQQDQTCDGDHHHCHAHSVSVLPSLLTFATLPNALDQEPEEFNGFQSFSSNRIERPKWV